MPKPVILITRPQPDAGETAAILEAQLDVPVIVSPLLGLEVLGPLPATSADDRLIFTSANGVRAWTQLNGPRRSAICVGATTAAFARASGLEAEARGGTADRLVQAILADPPTGRLLHIRGEIAQGAVAQTLSRHGMDAEEQVLYRMQAQAFSAEARSVTQGAAPVIVPLYSSRSAELFAKAWGLPAPGAAPLYLVCMSATVEAATAPLHAQRSVISSTPDRAGMLRGVAEVARWVESRGAAH
ncbi:uroporphyrinogen-III synthase [Pseudooceanicola sp. C21-150M6]|uniref:uroporphyrinogen-III synthase n=1 Tax=Pseudooceanicola sp. C21-150M6 TaxID=3434355 RepID=UPI003D7F63B0